LLGEGRREGGREGGVHNVVDAVFVFVRVEGVVVSTNGLNDERVEKH